MTELSLCSLPYFGQGQHPILLKKTSSEKKTTFLFIHLIDFFVSLQMYVFKPTYL